MIGRAGRAISRGLVAAATAGLVVAPTLSYAQPSPVGINAAVRNQVQIRDAGTPRIHPAVPKARVMLNDEVRTGAGSQLQILLLDRSTFTVGANARIAVDRFVYDRASNSRSTGISVAKGAFRFMSGRVLGHPSGPANVRTPVASIGIRGTIFEGAVGPDAIALASQQPAVIAAHVRPDPEKGTFIVLRGPGPNTQGDTRPGAIDVEVGGKTITLDRPGMALFVPGFGLPPIGPFQVTPAALQTLQRLLRTTPDMAPAMQALNQSAGSGVQFGPPPGDSGGQSPGGMVGGGSAGGQGGGHSFLYLALGGIAAAIAALVAFQSGNNNNNTNMPRSP